jgi:hydroxyacylglutathione hydrolase
MAIAFTFGEVLVTARHTPGIPRAHVVFVGRCDHPDEPWGILTGDSLFVSSAGRPDLLGRVTPKSWRDNNSERCAIFISTCRTT